MAIVRSSVMGIQRFLTALGRGALRILKAIGRFTTRAAQAIAQIARKALDAARRGLALVREGGRAAGARIVEAARLAKFHLLETIDRIKRRLTRGPRVNAVPTSRVYNPYFKKPQASNVRRERPTPSEGAAATVLEEQEEAIKAAEPQLDDKGEPEVVMHETTVARPGHNVLHDLGNVAAAYARYFAQGSLVDKGTGPTPTEIGELDSIQRELEEAVR